MTHLGYLSSAVILSLVLVSFVLVITHMREWRSYSPQIGAGRPEQRNRADSIYLPIIGPSNKLTLMATLYFVIIFAIIAATIATLYGSIGDQILIGALTTILGAYLVYGLIFSSRVPDYLNRYGYRLKQSVSFRRRPLWSLVIGYLTFLTILLSIGLIVIALWIGGAGAVGFLIGLSVLLIIIVGYAVSSAQVSVFPASLGGIGQSAHKRTKPSFTNPIPNSLSGGGRFTHDRVWPVLRGWLNVTILLIVGTMGVAAIWWIGGGLIGFILGLCVVGILAAGYAVPRRGEWALQPLRIYRFDLFAKGINSI